MPQLRDKIALITGGTSGIGLATAALFHSEGARVFVTGQYAETIASARAELPPEVAILRADARSLVDAEAVATTIRDTAGSLDVVFLNAGVGRFLPFSEVDEDFYDLHMDVNVKGAVFTLKAVLPLLRPGASVVVNASVVGREGRRPVLDRLGEQGCAGGTGPIARRRARRARDPRQCHQPGANRDAFLRQVRIPGVDTGRCDRPHGFARTVAARRPSRRGRADGAVPVDTGGLVHHRQRPACRWGMGRLIDGPGRPSACPKRLISALAQGSCVGIAWFSKRMPGSDRRRRPLLAVLARQWTAGLLDPERQQQGRNGTFAARSVA